MDIIVCGRGLVIEITQFRRCMFKKNWNIFRNFELEIALAIPASNDVKYNWNNLAGQGLKREIKSPISALNARKKIRNSAPFLKLATTLAAKSQQTQNICITFVQRWSSFEDVGPSLYECYTNVLCLLGIYAK